MNKIIKYLIAVVTVVVVAFATNFLEIDFGRCLNDDGDGKLYNGESYYNYISYHNIAKENDIVMTFSVNDFNKECLERWDYIILKNVN